MNSQATAADLRTKIIVALDLPSREEALRVVRRLSPHPGVFKIGLQLYTAAGPEMVRAVQGEGGRVFLDLKLHDIPNTVARATENASSLGVEMLTLHLAGGRRMIEAAVGAASSDLLLLGVTVLTSTDEETLRETGVEMTIEEQVLRLAKLGAEAGVGGLIASARELEPLRAALGHSIKIVTPGIRPANSSPNDQKRTLSPAAALRAGADFLVIGRPIVAAADPRRALEAIIADAV
jgi:orotidine-5'-phosphate decarboxylase